MHSDIFHEFLTYDSAILLRFKLDELVFILNVEALQKPPVETTKLTPSGGVVVPPQEDVDFTKREHTDHFVLSSQVFEEVVVVVTLGSEFLRLNHLLALETE